MSEYIKYEVRVYPNGSKYWYLNGKLHREDGPAIEYSNGSKYWYLNGEWHREDGPACEDSDGSKLWYVNGKPHREDGPACEYSDGSKYWYLNGREFTELEFDSCNSTCDGKIVEIDGKKYELKEVR